MREDDELADTGYEELTTFADRNRRSIAAREDDYSGYAHVIVDEAQDITPMQWRALGRRGRRATWTIVGDPAQRSWDDRHEAEEARRAATGGKAEKRFVFNTNYRTPAEVVALADAVLQRIEPCPRRSQRGPLDRRESRDRRRSRRSRRCGRYGP